jgi:hypothetical protein
MRHGLAGLFEIVGNHHHHLGASVRRGGIARVRLHLQQKDTSMTDTLRDIRNRLAVAVFNEPLAGLLPPQQACVDAMLAAFDDTCAKFTREENERPTNRNQRLMVHVATDNGTIVIEQHDPIWLAAYRAHIGQAAPGCSK